MMTGLFVTRVRRKLHNALTNAKNKTFEYYIASLSKDDHTIWKATKKFKRPKISIPPIRKSDRSWAKSDSEKATTFAEHLEQVFTPHSNINHNDSEIQKFLEIPCQMSSPIKPFLPREVVQEIKTSTPRLWQEYFKARGKVKWFRKKLLFWIVLIMRMPLFYQLFLDLLYKMKLALQMAFWK
jgi:hypothetical protein